MNRQKAFALLGMDQLAPPAEVPVLEARPEAGPDQASGLDCPLSPPAPAELELLTELREWDPEGALDLAIAVAQRYGTEACFEAAFSSTSALDERAKISSLLPAAGLRHKPGASTAQGEPAAANDLPEACKRIARGEGGSAEAIIRLLEEMPPTQKVEPTAGAEVARAAIGLVASGETAAGDRLMAALAARMPATVVKRMSAREIQDVRLARELTRQGLDRATPVAPETLHLLAEGVSHSGARPNEVIADIERSEYPIIRNFLKDRPALSAVYEPHLLRGLGAPNEEPDFAVDVLRVVGVIVVIASLAVTLWRLAS